MHSDKHQISHILNSYGLQIGAWIRLSETLKFSLIISIAFRFLWTNQRCPRKNMMDPKSEWPFLSFFSSSSTCLWITHIIYEMSGITVWARPLSKYWAALISFLFGLNCELMKKKSEEEITYWDASTSVRTGLQIN